MGISKTNQQLGELARLAQVGLATPAMMDELATMLYSASRPSILAAVKVGRLQYKDVDDCQQWVVIHAIQRIGSWDMRKGQVTTWLGGIIQREILKIQQQYLEDTVVGQVLGNNYVDLKTVVPCEAIRCNPDALYDWDEQLGRWECDNVAVDAGMLAVLRNQIMKRYNLRRVK